MELFIGNLPPKVALGELIAFFKGFSSKCTIHMKQEKLDDGNKVVYAVAEFENDKYAERFFEKFSGQEFRGQALEIREYYHRSYTNERRAVDWREKPWRAGERRRNDDRRHKLIHEEHDIFKDAILPSGEEEQDTLDEQAAHLKVHAYRDLARKD